MRKCGVDAVPAKLGIAGLGPARCRPQQTATRPGPGGFRRACATLPWAPDFHIIFARDRRQKLAAIPGLCLPRACAGDDLNMTAHSSLPQRRLPAPASSSTRMPAELRDRNAAGRAVDPCQPILVASPPRSGSERRRRHLIHVDVMDGHFVPN